MIVLLVAASVVASRAGQDVPIIVDVVVAEFLALMRLVAWVNGRAGDADDAHYAVVAGAVAVGALGAEGGDAALAAGGGAGLGLGLGVRLAGEEEDGADEQGNGRMERHGQVLSVCRQDWLERLIKG